MPNYNELLKATKDAESAEARLLLNNGGPYPSLAALAADRPAAQYPGAQALVGATIEAAQVAQVSGGVWGIGGGASSASPYSGVMTFRQVTPGSNSAAPANNTYTQQIPVDKKFFGVRLLLVNYNTGSSSVIERVKCAAAPTADNDGSTLNWLPVTFSGSSSVTLPAATVGPDTGGGSNTVPSVAWSDTIWVSAVDRTDFAGAPYLLQVRAHSAAGMLFFSSSAITDPDGAAWTQDRGYDYSYKFTSGDIVTTPSATSGAWLRGSMAGVALGGDFLVGGNAAIFDAFGDSLVAGNLGSAGSQSGWCIRADYAYRIAGKPVSVSNWGHSTMRHINYITVMKAAVSARVPDVVYFPAGSPNNPSLTTQAGWDLMYAQTVDAIYWLKAKGVKRILLGTFYPWNAGNNTLRSAFNTRIKSTLAGICTVVDVAAVVEDPANPGKILPAYDAGDGLHINAAAYDAVTPVVMASAAL